MTFPLVGLYALGDLESMPEEGDYYCNKKGINIWGPLTFQQLTLSSPVWYPTSLCQLGKKFRVQFLDTA